MPELVQRAKIYALSCRNGSEVRSRAGAVRRRRSEKEEMALTRSRNRAARQNASARKPAAKRVEQLTGLLHELDSMRDQERKHLARELHDTLVASLSASKLECDWLRRPQQASDAQRVQRLSRLSAALADAIQFTRTVIDQLWPVAVQHLGLIAAFQAQLSVVDPRFAAEKRPDVEGDVDTVPETHALTLYRAVQDVLPRLDGVTPVRAELAVRRGAKGVELQLNLRSAARRAATLPQRSVGLTRERVLQLGGKYLLAGADRGALRLQVFLPLFPPEADGRRPRARKRDG